MPSIKKWGERQGEIKMSQGTQAQLRAPATWSPSGGHTAVELQLSLVIPACNEEKTIQRTLTEYVHHLDGRCKPYEILVVLNGCQDKTLEQILAFREQHPQVGWTLLTKAGKGRAVALGFQLARGKLVGFVDADGQIPPEEFIKLIDALKQEPMLAGVVASKYAEPRNRAHTPFLRCLAGRVFSFLIRQLLGLPLQDTQCGAKVFRREVLRDVLLELTLTGWTFDVELLWQLYQRGYLLREVPVLLRPERRPSRLSFLRVAPRMLYEVLALRRRATRATKRTNASQARRRLGEILCELGRLQPSELEEALRRQRADARRPRIGEVLIQMGLVTLEDVRLALALQGVI